MIDETTVAIKAKSMSMRAARVNAGMNVRDAAKKLGVTPQTLCRYEGGKTDVTLKMAWKMAELYKVPLSALDPGD